MTFVGVDASVRDLPKTLKRVGVMVKVFDYEKEIVFLYNTDLLIHLCYCHYGLGW